MTAFDDERYRLSSMRWSQAQKMTGWRVLCGPSIYRLLVNMRSLVNSKFSITQVYLTFKIEPTLANDLLSGLFGCQHQEKVLVFHASPWKWFHSRLAIDSRLRIGPVRELWECLIHVLYSFIDYTAGFNNFVEPSNIVYGIPTPSIDRAIDRLKSLLHVVLSPKEENVKVRAREMHLKRVCIIDEAVETAVSTW